MSIIALSYLISILYSGLKHGEEPNFTPRRIPESPPGTHGPSRAPDVCVALGADAASDCLALLLLTAVLAHRTLRPAAGRPLRLPTSSSSTPTPLPPSRAGWWTTCQ